MDTAESMETHGEKGRDETLLPPLSRSGDTSPCRMTGVTLHSHVRYTKNRGPHVAVGWVGGLRRSFPPISYLLVVPCPLSPVSLSPRGEAAARGDVSVIHSTKSPPTHLSAFTLAVGWVGGAQTQLFPPSLSPNQPTFTLNPPYPTHLHTLPPPRWVGWGSSNATLPLSPRGEAGARGDVSVIQGYLAHKKQPPRRTLQ